MEWDAPSSAVEGGCGGIEGMEEREGQREEVGIGVEVNEEL